jgi:ParB family chromosome partitioning protein
MGEPPATQTRYKAKDIPLELLDEPEIPERETMEEAELAELAFSIREVGLIQPLTVIQRGERYEVTAGHRRLLACRLTQYSPVPCRIRTSGTTDPLAVLVAENAHRENVNPVEEARFYSRLLDEQCGNDVDALCVKVRRRREYVEDRLNILRGYPEVVAALQAKKISLAVARELNKVADPNRLLVLLDTSIQQGASARQVMEWRKASDLMTPIVLPDDGTAEQTTEGAAPPAAFAPQCIFCEGTEHPHMMEFAYVHSPCKSILERMLQRQAQPAGAGE